MFAPLLAILPAAQVKEDYELSVMDYKYDLSLVNEAIRASQLGQKGEDVVSRDPCAALKGRMW